MIIKKQLGILCVFIVILLSIAFYSWYQKGTQNYFWFQFAKGYIKISNDFYLEVSLPTEYPTEFKTFENNGQDFYGLMVVGDDIDAGLKYAKTYTSYAEYPIIKKYSFNSFNVVEYSSKSNKALPGYLDKIVFINRGGEFLILYGEYKKGYIRNLLLTYTVNP